MGRSGAAKRKRDGPTTKTSAGYTGAKKVVIPKSQSLAAQQPAKEKITTKLSIFSRDEINQKLKEGSNVTSTTTTTTATVTTTSTKVKKEPPLKKARVEVATISSNWKALQQALPKQKKKPTSTPTEEKKTQALKALPPPIKDDKSLTKLIALDCEMVGVGIDGKESMLARVCIVNSFGNVIYDKFVQPRERVVDYRTWVSGVRKSDLKGPNAFPFSQIQKEVAELIKGRIVVGHGLENDFKALLLSHPFANLRDTARYRPLQRSRGKPRRLRYLANKILGVNIQEKGDGAHDPTIDARAALMIYKHLKRDWEEFILKKQKHSLRKKKKADKKKKKAAEKQAKAESQAQKAKEADEAEAGEDEVDFDDGDDDDDDDDEAFNIGSTFNFDDDLDDDDESD